MTVNWLSNIRMAYKILCLAFVAAIGLAAVSFNGFSSLRATEQTVDELSSVYLPAKQYLADNQLNMRKIQSGMLEAIATPQPDRRVKMKKDLEDKYTTDFLAAWNSYKELAGQMNGGAGIDAVEQAWKEYRSTAQQVIDLTIAGQQEAASALYAGEGIRKLNALKNSLNDLQEACDAEVSQAQAANAAESAATNRRMVVISLIAFVLLVFAAVYIIREITGALSKMIGVCRELKEGDFSDHSVSMERGDEFGEMWAALLAVRTNLRRLMGKFSETSEQLAAASEQLTASSQQSAEASGQVAQSVTDAAAAAAQQQDSVDRSNQAVAEVSASVHEIESTSVRVAPVRSRHPNGLRQAPMPWRRPSARCGMSKVRCSLRLRLWTNLASVPRKSVRLSIRYQKYRIRRIFWRLMQPLKRRAPERRDAALPSWPMKCASWLGSRRRPLSASQHSFRESVRIRMKRYPLCRPAAIK